MRNFHFFSIFAIAASLSCYSAQATETNSVAGQRQFDSPNDAAKALLAAAKKRDYRALREIFGPSQRDMLTGDKVQDDTNLKHFSQSMAAAWSQEPAGENRVILDIGTNRWPFPIPLVKTNDQWYFDTEAGQDEIINRHIGRDELHAIGICRAYVAAQIQYFDNNGAHKYAKKFKSSPGLKDGLCSSDETCFLPDRVAESCAVAGEDLKRSQLQPFHGYIFRILTAQGHSAPGGKLDYLVNGDLLKGFGMIAYPVQWGKAGIMTFIVDKEGKVYERDYGEKTWEIASRLKEYNPDKRWSEVTEQGIPPSS